MIRTFFGMIVVVIMTLICGLGAVLAGAFNPYSRVVYYLGLIWARCILWIAGARLIIEGLQNIDLKRQYVFIGNHQSHFDVLTVFSAIPLIMRFLTKKELFKIPVFGWALSAVGMIKIDRAHHEESVKSMNEALEVMRRNKISLVVFPEGTRSPDGKLGTFKKGGFIIAIKGKIPIVPISISGSRFVLPKHSSRATPGPIKMVIAKPIETGNYTYLNRDELMTRTIDTIKNNIDPAYNEKPFGRK
jgi:1-acyl-sn-glycerol-3-phosphate acyltransferase